MGWQKIRFLDVTGRGILAIHVLGQRRAKRTKPLRALGWGETSMFTQILDPTGNLFLTWLVALIPVVLLLFLLAGLRMSAWLAVLIGSIVTFLLGLWVCRCRSATACEPIFTARRPAYGMSTGSRFGE